MNGIGNASSFTTEKLSVFDDARFTGTLKLQNASGTSNALEFPSGHMISTSPAAKDFTFYGNRANGQNPFVIRSHVNESSYRVDLTVGDDGSLIVPQTYYNESSNSPNIRMGTSSSPFYRTTSARRSKLAIEDISVDPYNLLKVKVRDWYDKTNTEKYAELLTKRQEGESVNFGEIEPIKRIGGLVAEEVEDVGLEMFVEYDENGRVVNLQYDRLWTLLIPIVKDLKERLDKLESN